MSEIQTPELDAFLAQGSTPSTPQVSAPAGPTAGPTGAAPSMTPELDAFVAPELERAKFGTPGQQAIAGLEGAARGATLGASDAAETKLLGIPKENVRGRMEANPWTSNLGQLGGAGALIAGTGGIAGPLEAGLGGGTAARALSFGLEGSLFGAGQAVSDQALGDQDLAGQQVLADVGMGAAMGAGLGVLSKGVEAVLPAATRKLGNALGGLKEMALGTAEEPSLLVKAASIPGSVASGKSPENWTEAFYEGLNRPDKTVSIRGLTKNLQELHDAGRQAATDLYETAAPENIGKALETMPVENARQMGFGILDKIEQAVNPIAEGDETMAQVLSPSSQKIIENRLTKLTDSLHNADSAHDVHGALDSFAKDTGKLIKFDTLPTANQMQEQELLRGLRTFVRENLSDEGAWGEAAQHYAQISKDYSEYTTARKNFQKAFMRGEEAKGGKRFVVDPVKVKAFFNSLGDSGQDLKAGYLNQFIKETENLAHSSENYHGFKSAEDSLSKRVQELAKEHSQLKGVASQLQNKASGESHLFQDAALGYGAHAIGIPHPVVGAALGTLEAYRAVKNPYQAGVTLANTAQKLRVIGDISDRVTSKITTLAKGLFSGAVGRAAAAPASHSLAPVFASTKDFDQKTHRLAELSVNPNVMMDHLTHSTTAMFEAAPNVSQSVQASMIRGVQFLDSKVPRSPNQLPLSGKWEPSKSQIATFGRYYRAVNDPLSVLHDVKNGTLGNESLEALQAVHPKLFNQMQQAVMENLDPKNADKIPYATKISVSRFLGHPLDESLMPQSIASKQAAFNQMRAEEAQKAERATGPKPTQKGLSKITLGKRTSLTPDRDEN